MRCSVLLLALLLVACPSGEPPDDDDATSLADDDDAAASDDDDATSDDDDDATSDDDDATSDDDDAAELPAWVEAVDVALTTACDGCAVGEVVVSFGCAGREDLLVLDRDGAIASWVDVGATSIAGFTFTPQGTVLGIEDREHVVEWDLGSGEELTRLTKDVTPGFDRYVHHDVLRLADGRILAITATDWTDDDGNVWIADGVMTVDGGAVVDSWDTVDIGFLPEPPESEDTGYWNGRLSGQDWTHGNGLSVDGSGAVLLSLTGQHTIVRVDDGVMTWKLDGASVESDFELSASAGGPADFFGFHHVRAIPGGVELYDNRNPHDGCAADPTPPCEDARYIAVDLDPEAGTADITTSVSLGRDCPTQGSATLLEDGNVVATCSEDQSLREVTPDGEIVWQVNLSCPESQDTGPIYRALPIP